ncbi:MAG: HEPN domain-containing protein [Candidatus Tritonobacter lacicola]|nr:HEPN domain-containing protein [Candidatus Tritonobacter lacicola]
MPERSRDWLRQARRDLEHAKLSAWGEDFEWACFSAQQAAEKAVKGLYISLKGEAWGHSVTQLLSNLPGAIEIPEGLIEKAKEIDKHYIFSRYPNGFDVGIPADYYTRAEAERAIEYAETILAFCENKVR